MRSCHIRQRTHAVFLPDRTLSCNANIRCVSARYTLEAYIDPIYRQYYRLDELGQEDVVLSVAVIYLGTFAPLRHVDGEAVRIACGGSAIDPTRRLHAYQSLTTHNTVYQCRS